MNELNEALILLAAGMATVFTILLLVVLSAQLLIRVVNRFTPAPAANPKAIDDEELAALFAAVEIATQGKGKVVGVEKLKDEDKGGRIQE
jgi:oxaloacetate decarboxylase (Na+ extruding) subunit gamma